MSRPASHMDLTNEKEWRSKSDIDTRYEECLNCKELILDNWYLRHVKKCVENHAKGEQLFEEATQNHKNFKIALLASKDRPSLLLQNAPAPVEVLDAKIESLKNGYITTHEAIANEKKDPNIYKQAEPELEVTPKNQRVLDNFQKYTFKYGDMIDCVVTSIDGYGVFVNNINGNANKQGLIKISKARTTTVVNLHTHFRVGDKVRAEVIEVRSDGKLNLSTRKSVLPTYGNTDSHLLNTDLSEKLAPLKEQIVVVASKEDKNIEEVLTFIQNKIGLVSPEAKARIKEMLDKKGMFTFMMALAKVADFQVDVGLMFAAEIEKKMGDHP